MSKIVFLNAPAYGHTNPTLALVKELVDRGNEVIYYSFPEFKEKILSTGAQYREYRNCPKLVDNAKLVRKLSYLYYFVMYATYTILDGLIEDIKFIKPDLIIYDGLCFWGKCVSQITNIPSVSSLSICLFTTQAISFRLMFKELCKLRFQDIKNLLHAKDYQNKISKKYQLPKHKIIDNFINTSDLNIVYTSRDFQPLEKQFNDRNYKFVGPSIYTGYKVIDDIEYGLLKKPIIYVSLGTILNDNIKFYDNCIKALKNFHGTVVMSVGDKTDVNKFKHAPVNFIIKNHVNQIELLKYVDVFITHGGMNSVQESLFHGVPLIVYPSQIEQEIIGMQVEKRGCGVLLKNNSPDNIMEAINKLLNNKFYKTNCENMSKSLIKAGGYKKAVDYILDFKTKIRLKSDIS